MEIKLIKTLNDRIWLLSKAFIQNFAMILELIIIVLNFNLIFISNK